MSDRIGNEYITSNLGASIIIGKIREYRLRWFGHFNRRNIDNIVKKIGELKVGVGYKSRKK